MTPKTHRQIRLAARPVGYPKESDFRLVESSVPEPGAGEMLVRVVYLSLDPYMRGRMSDARSYVPPVALGDVMEGGTVGEVVHSNHISQYNLTEPELAPRNERFILVNRVRVQGFIVFDFAARYREGLGQLTEWVRQGKLKYREDIVDGLEGAPGALIGLLPGRNFGKMVVRVGPEPASVRTSGAAGPSGPAGRR